MDMSDIIRKRDEEVAKINQAYNEKRIPFIIKEKAIDEVYTECLCEIRERELQNR